MAVNDPIADMLTRMRNALLLRRDSVVVPGSKLKAAVLKVFREEGFVEDFEVFKKGPQPDIRVRLKYRDGESVIREIRRVSKPGRRVYRGADQMGKVRNGFGISVVSTSRGVVSDRECRSKSLGGEILCEVW
jgi:small subunit ribosomal protein S8